MNRRGVFYSVGTGPGDPELLTYQAVKTMEKCAIIALPNSGAAENAVSYTHLDVYKRQGLGRSARRKEG